MPDNTVCLQNEIITTIIDLRLEHFDSYVATKPKVPHNFGGKEMLKQRLPISRVEAMFCGSHVPAMQLPCCLFG